MIFEGEKQIVALEIRRLTNEEYLWAEITELFDYPIKYINKRECSSIEEFKDKVIDFIKNDLEHNEKEILYLKDAINNRTIFPVMEKYYRSKF